MRLSFRKKSFLYSESGAVAVEWVVLIAPLISLAALMLLTIETSVSDATAGTATKMTTMGTGG